MTKRPLSRNEFEQTEGAQRPPVVALRGRSRLRERPGGVAARRRSGSLFVSDLAVSLRSRRSQLERPYGVAPEHRCKVALVPPSDGDASDIGVLLWPSRSGLRERLRVVALIGRSGSVFGFHRDEMASDFSASLW